MKRRFRLWVFFLCMLSIFAIVASQTYSAASAARGFLIFPLFARGTCQSGWMYDHISVIGYPMVRIGPPYQNYNGTDEKVTATFTSIIRKRVAVAFNIQYTFNLNTIITSVQKSTGKTVAAELEVETDNAMTMSIPGHKTGYALFGVYEVEVSGNYYYQDQSCNRLYEHDNVISYCPWYAGWTTKIIEGDASKKVKATPTSKKK